MDQPRVDGRLDYSLFYRYRQARSNPGRSYTTHPSLAIGQRTERRSVGSTLWPSAGCYRLGTRTQ
ncbi:unnamed protein product [Ectocarpus sp. 6 AP-2014]